MTASHLLESSTTVNAAHDKINKNTFDTGNSEITKRNKKPALK
jgi:hypothetical protein